jgi:hypothetical protein
MEIPAEGPLRNQGEKTRRLQREIAELLFPALDRTVGESGDGYLSLRLRVETQEAAIRMLQTSDPHRNGNNELTGIGFSAAIEGREIAIQKISNGGADGQIISRLGANGSPGILIERHSDSSDMFAHLCSEGASGGSITVEGDDQAEIEERMQEVNRLLEIFRKMIIANYAGLIKLALMKGDQLQEVEAQAIAEKKAILRLEKELIAKLRKHNLINERCHTFQAQIGKTSVSFKTSFLPNGRYDLHNIKIEIEEPRPIINAVLRALTGMQIKPTEIVITRRTVQEDGNETGALKITKGANQQFKFSAKIDEGIEGPFIPNVDVSHSKELPKLRGCLQAALAALDQHIATLPTP